MYITLETVVCKRVFRFSATVQFLGYDASSPVIIS